MWDIKDIIMNITILDIIDISIVAYVFYKLYMLIKETSAEQLIKGIFVLLVATKLSELLQLHVVHWVLENTISIGVIAILIVFQPELRRALEYIGRTKFISKPIGEFDEENIDEIIEELIEAIYSLSRQKIGALIIIERETGINDIIQTGTIINAKITRQILINIFIPNTPLHDGALVIKNNRVRAAGCFLPLTDSKYVNKELGTRHRAGIGISERSDCISIIVSEETGMISIAENGKLYKSISKEYIKNILNQNFKKQGENKRIFKRGVFFK